MIAMKFPVLSRQIATVFGRYSILFCRQNAKQVFKSFNFKNLRFSIFSSFLPSLIVLKVLNKEENKVNKAKVIKTADSLYDDGKYEELYAALVEFQECDEPEILWRLARSIFEKCRNLKEDKAKLEHYETALQLVEKATKIDDKCWAAHKWYAILLDYVWRYKSTKGRIIHSFDIKKHMERAVELNPSDATSYYLIGEWCYTFADMPWYQRNLAAAIFASPPTSTYLEALEYFEKAEKVSPLFYSMNLLMLGKCHLKLNDKEKGIMYLKQARDYSIKTPDDKKAYEEAVKLLKDFKI